MDETSRQIELLKLLNSRQPPVIKYVGLTLMDVLFCLFLGLKLGGVGAVARWGWLWIFAPIWAPSLVRTLWIYVMKVARHLGTDGKA